MKLSITLLLIVGLMMALGGMLAMQQAQVSRAFSRKIDVLNCKIHCNEYAQLEISMCETLDLIDIDFSRRDRSNVNVNHCILDANAVYQNCKLGCENTGKR
jgi:hypothetical protein